jgi:hypothetical protein
VIFLCEALQLGTCFQQQAINLLYQMETGKIKDPYRSVKQEDRNIGKMLVITHSRY